jgi:hypothetical protein
MKEIVLQLNSLDMIFLGIALVSLFINLFQFMIWWRDQKKFYRPLSSSLIGLFNDIKTKITHAFATQNLLFSAKNPHKELETLRWEYAAFTNTVINYLNGFQEIVVSILATLNPSDKEGKEAFRASDFGLTEEEKQQRKEVLSRVMQQQLHTVGRQPAQPTASEKKVDS